MNHALQEINTKRFHVIFLLTGLFTAQLAFAQNADPQPSEPADVVTEAEQSTTMEATIDGVEYHLVPEVRAESGAFGDPMMLVCCALPVLIVISCGVVAIIVVLAMKLAATKRELEALRIKLPPDGS